MASNDLEVLDPAAPVEKVMESKSGHELDRRDFFTALGVAGIAAGAAILSKPAEAQQPSNPAGYAQVDVINFLLNIKYLKATLYSFITQGTDLPGSSFVTLGTGAVLNQPAKITFSSQQITDIFNEMYYDELNQLIALRALYSLPLPQNGTALAARQTMNLLGTGPSGSLSSGAATTTTLTQSQAIALARLLEDLSASAFAAATTYLTGTNLQLVAQSLASDGQHAGLIRLLSIQNGVQYQGTQYASVTTSNTAQAAVTFTGVTLAGSSLLYVNLGTNLPTVGNVVTGPGVPPGAGAIITGVTSNPTITFTGVPVSKASSLVFASSSISKLSSLGGQPVTGTYVPAGSYTTPGGIGTNTVSLSTAGVAASLSGSATVAPNGFITNGSSTITTVSSTTGLISGETITGTGIQAGTTISSFSSSAATITLSLPATITGLVVATGFTTNGSDKVTNLSTVTGFIIGQPVSGAGIPSGATILNLPTSNSLQLSVPATATTAGSPGVQFQGIVTSGSAAITLVPSTAGLAVGQVLGGTGIAPGTTIASISGTTVTAAAKATASSTISPGAVITSGSNILTNVPSVAGLTIGQPVTGTGIPASTTITAIGTNTVTISNAATITTPAGATFTSPAVTTVTSPTADTYTVAQSTITLAQPATATGFGTFYIVIPDNTDVEPGDPGTAASSATGPSAIPGTNPAIYQGFFNTAGSNTASANTPSGFAFAKTFQQVLAVLYGYNSTNSAFATQNYEGGFFPVGVSGPINSVT
jgi:hypothetical protein